MKQPMNRTHDVAEATCRLARVLEARSAGGSERGASGLVGVELAVPLPAAAPRSAGPGLVSTLRGWWR